MYPRPDGPSIKVKNPKKKKSNVSVSHNLSPNYNAPTMSSVKPPARSNGRGAGTKRRRPAPMSAAVKREIKNQCYLASEPKVLKAFADTRTVGTSLAKISFLDNWHSPYIANTRFTATDAAYNLRLWNLDPQVGNANPDNVALKDFMKRSTDFDERVGRRVTIESVDETLVLQISNNGTDPNTFPDVINVRVIHGWLKYGVDDAGTTGYLASVNEIYEDIDDVRIKVLSDKLYTRRAPLGS